MPAGGLLDDSDENDETDENENDDDDDDDNDDDATRRKARTASAGNPARQGRGYNPRYHGQEWANAAINPAPNDLGLVSDDDVYLAGLPFETTRNTFESRTMIALHKAKLDADGLLTGTHPLALAARANADDTPNYYEAMNGNDSLGFLEAMKQELAQLESMEAWEIIPRSQAMGKTYCHLLGPLNERGFPMDAFES